MTWELQQQIERDYRLSLKRVFDQFVHALMGFGITDPRDISNLLYSFVDTEYFKEFAQRAASDMVTGIMTGTAKSWRAAARESMQGKRIYNALMSEVSRETISDTFWGLVKSNAELISTFPLDIAKDVNKFITEETFRGRRSEFIAKDLLEKFPDVTKGRINLISRTETAKANTELLRAQSEEVDLPWYIWRTAKDGTRVRESHRIMEGVLCSWNDPPNPEKLAGEKKSYGAYAPGEIFNCRCWPEIVILIQQIKFPCKVHFGGVIEIMSKLRFESIAGMKMAA